MISNFSALKRKSDLMKSILIINGASSNIKFAPYDVGKPLKRGCLNCHLIESHGGRRGPPLTEIENKLSSTQMILRIYNGGVNMPAYAANLTPAEMDALVAFLQARKTQGQ